MSRRRESIESRFRENLVDELWRYGQELELLKLENKRNSRERNQQYFILIDELIWLSENIPLSAEELSDGDLDRQLADLAARCRSEALRSVCLPDLRQIVRKAAARETVER